MNNICIIPARGGSKRIPKKNITPFHGRPLLAWAIEAAQKSGLFGKNIFVSSDSDEILKIAKRYGAKTIKRPPAISGDKATLQQAALHLLENEKGQNFDNLCMLLPSCPLRKPEDIKKAYQILIHGKSGSVMSVVRYHWLYPFWALQEIEGRLKTFFDKRYFIDSKKLPKNIYCPSGAVRWVKIKKFLKTRVFYTPDLVKYVIPLERSVDIDNYEDLKLAKKLYKTV